MFFLAKLIAPVIFTLSTLSAKELTSQKLKMADYDQMRSMVEKKVIQSRKMVRKLGEEPDSVDEQNAIEPLREAMFYVLARPDTDNIVAKLMPDLRRELNNFDAFDETLLSVGETLLVRAKNKNLPLEVRVTTSYQLQNLLAELSTMKPKNRDSMNAFLKKIIDEKIEVDSEVASFRKLNFMDQTPIFKKIAEKLLK